MAAFINSLSSGKKTPAGVNSIRIESGYGALVDPVNSCPYIFVLPDLVHEFSFEPGSGTDHLRQRIKSGVEFTELVNKHRAAFVKNEVESSSLPNLIIRSLAIVQDAPQFKDSPPDGGAVAESLTAVLPSRVTRVHASQMFRSQSVMRH